ncbi:hypothetical protein Tco_0069125, partial [Tanacetum coccineum]
VFLIAFCFIAAICPKTSCVLSQRSHCNLILHFVVAFCLLKTIFASKNKRYVVQIATNLAFCLEDLAFCSLRLASKSCVLSQDLAFCPNIAFCQGQLAFCLIAFCPDAWHLDLL